MYPFNESIDKITERELVYNILNRLSFGDSLVGDNGITYADANSKLTEYLANMGKLIFPANTNNVGALKTVIIKVAKGTSTGLATVTGLKTPARVIRAISQQTGLDYSELCTIDTMNGVSSISFNCQTPLLNDDYLTLFVE